MLVAQQQQRALAAAAAAQQTVAQTNNPLLQTNVLQNFAQNLLANGMNNAQVATTPQNFFCILCMKHFNNQAAFTLHLSVVHLRNGMLNAIPQGMTQAAEANDADVSWLEFISRLLFLFLKNKKKPESIKFSVWN